MISLSTHITHLGQHLRSAGFPALWEDKLQQWSGIWVGKRRNAATVTECARGRKGPSAAQQEWGRRAMGAHVEIAPWGLAMREVSMRKSKAYLLHTVKTPDSIRLTSRFPRKYMSCIFIWGWGGDEKSRVFFLFFFLIYLF